MSEIHDSNNISGNERKVVTRRQFLGYTGAAVVGTALSKPGFAGRIDPHIKPQTGMKYRRLGRTNLMISEVGVGCASMSLSRTLGPFLFEKWLRERGDVINKLLDLGGNFVSTTPYYHNTVELLGKAVEGRRDEVYLAIGIYCGPEKKMRAHLEKALKDLQTDVIDLGFAYGNGDDESFAVWRKFRKEGKVRFIGMSGHDPRKHEWAIRKGYVDWIHMPYNRLSRIKQGPGDLPGAERLFELSKANDVGVICIKPMTGNFIPNWAKEAASPEIQEIMKKLKDYGPSNLYQAMLRWILQNSNVTACAVGMDTVQQVVENCEAVKTRKLTAEQKELLEMYAGIADKDFCRMCETCDRFCPRGIAIADILRYRMYYKSYGRRVYAKNLYSELADCQKVTQCDGCRLCERNCPNQLAVVEKLQEAASILTDDRAYFC
jgi:predicted aldo/keto reductase-like oxidoreductase